MAKQQLLVYPSVQELPYRGRIDPYVMNLMLRSIEESTLRAILRGSESQDLLGDLSLAVNASYQGMQAITQKINWMQGDTKGYLYATAFNNIVNQSGHIDSVAGIATLDWSQNRRYTKIPRYDTDNDGIADTVMPNVTMYVDGVQRPVEDKAYNCLNRDNRSFWIEQVTPTFDNIHTIEIDLPPALNKEFNYVEVAPMPLFGMVIKTIEFQDIYGHWQTIFDKDNQSYKFYTDSGPIVMHLAPKQSNGVYRITVIALPGIYSIGFSCIDIALVDYTDNVETMFLQFENVPKTLPKTYTLGSFDFDFYIDGTTSYSNFISELAIVNGTTPSADKVPIRPVSHDTYYFNGQTINLNNSKPNMYLKVVMNKNGSTTPVIRGCQLQYS